jgi:hypothetical protein
MAQHIAEKLRLTSALLGTVSRKDLAAAFRRSNPETAFDLVRADKWLQGRSQPRQLSVYEDWSKVLDLGRSGAWIAQCDVEAFAEAICVRHGIDREELERRTERHAPSSAQAGQGAAAALTGSYACYSKALSPYYQGQLIRSILSIETEARPHGLTAAYTETLPTGPFLISGPIALTKSGLYAHLRDSSGDAQFFLSLFPPSPPGSVLAGYMCGATIIGPEPLPSVARILMIRLLNPATLPGEWGGYLAPQASIVEDLAGLGLTLDGDSRLLDQLFRQFLTETGSDGPCQIPATEFRTIVDVFDRHWLHRQIRADG